MWVFTWTKTETYKKLIGKFQMKSPPTCYHTSCWLKANKNKQFDSIKLEKAPESFFLLRKELKYIPIKFKKIYLSKLAKKNQKYNIHSVMKLIDGSFYKWTLLPVSKMHRRTPCWARWKSRKGGANDRSKRLTISMYLASAPL